MSEDRSCLGGCFFLMLLGLLSFIMVGCFLGDLADFLLNLRKRKPYVTG